MSIFRCTNSGTESYKFRWSKIKLITHPLTHPLPKHLSLLPISIIMPVFDHYNWTININLKKYIKVGISVILTV